MASIEAEVRLLMLAIPAIKALIGTRLYHRELPQTPAFPAVTYICANGHPQKKPLCTGSPVYRFACYSDVSFAAADAVRATIEDALTTFSGRIGDHVVTQAVYSGRDTPTEPESGRYRSDVLFRINYIRR